MTKPYPTIPEILKRIGYVADPGATVLTEEMVKTACDLDRERREAPAEVDRIDWAAIPWAMYVAKDEDQVVCAYLTEPLSDDMGEWLPTDPKCTIKVLDNATIPGPWQDSQRARPMDV